MQTCPNWALLHRRRGFDLNPSCSHLRAQCADTAPLYRLSKCSLPPETVTFPHQYDESWAFCAHVTVRYRMHKCLVTKLWLLAASFQVSIRLISDFIHIKHRSGKARLPFQIKPCCYTEASHHSRHYNTAWATSPFSEGFLFSLFTNPMYPEVPFPLPLPCHPQQSPTRSSSDTKQMVFFSF